MAATMKSSRKRTCASTCVVSLSFFSVCLRYENEIYYILDGAVMESGSLCAELRSREGRH